MDKNDNTTNSKYNNTYSYRNTWIHIRTLDKLKEKRINKMEIEEKIAIKESMKILLMITIFGSVSGILLILSREKLWVQIVIILISLIFTVGIAEKMILNSANKLNKLKEAKE